MGNPFIYGEAVKGENFADREEELKSLALDLSAGKNIYLFSPRRTGKTSLVLRLMDKLKQKGVICAYIDLFSVTSLERLGKLYANAVTRANTSKLEDAVQFVRSYFTTMGPKVSEGGDSSTLDIDFDSPRRNVGAWLNEIYDAPQTIAQKKGKKWVVILDEFQEALALGPDGAFERALAARIQLHNRVNYVFIGSNQHSLDEIFLNQARPLYAFANPKPLGKMPRETLADFIEGRFSSAHMKIKPKEVNRILSVTEEHPNYTQQLCHEVYNAALPRAAVLPEDVPAALDACLRAQSHAYTTLWESLAAKQRDVVTALSKEATANIYSQDFIARFNLGSSAAVQRAMEALLKKGLVGKENGPYALLDVFFIEWLHRKMG